jgi:Tfp pilus assembly major pilin PilA
MIVICLIGGGVAYFYIQRAEQNKYKEKTPDAAAANECINVKDINGNFLYTRDGLALCYLKLTPISIDLYSKTEKRNIVRTLTAEMSGTQFPFKFIAVSRPIDISPLLTELHSLLMTSDSKQRELLKAEMIEMSNFAMGGDIVERQFYIVMWDKAIDGVERELMGRARLMAENFNGSKISCEILKQQDIVRLCNLVNNPSYTHIEDNNFEAAIPLINGGIEI